MSPPTLQRLARLSLVPGICIALALVAGAYADKDKAANNARVVAQAADTGNQLSRANPSPAKLIGPALGSRLANPRADGNGGPLSAGVCPASSCVAGECILTQSLDPVTDGENQIACGAGGNTTENAWARCYNLVEEGVPPGENLTINSVTFGVQQATMDGINVDVILYLDCNGCPPDNPDFDAFVLATQSLVVNMADVGTMITVDFPAGTVVPAGTDLIVEIGNVDDGTDPPLFAFRTMSNDGGQCGPSYLRAIDCGNSGWDDLAEIGFPDSHMIQSVSASVGGVVTVDCPEIPETCGKGAGPCGEPNGTPGCEDELCCAAVCEIDPLCCIPGFEWTPGCVDIAINTVGCAAPVNDLCADAIPLEVPSLTLGTTAGANIDSTFSSCGTAITSPGVWYSVMGTGATITATTCTDFFGYDTKISVYCGSCDESFCVTGNDDDCADGASDLLSTVSWCSRPGEEYLILVHGFGGESGEFDLDVFDDGVACEPDFACAPLGACCLTADCFITTAEDCAAQGGDYQGDLTECGAGDPLIFEASPNIDLPDADPVGVSHTINVADSIIIGDLDVGLTITHTWVGDLCVSLEHNGVVVNVIQRPGADNGIEPCHSEGPFGCSSDNYVGIVLDDVGAGGPIEDACTANLTSPPNYVPNEALNAFNGMDSSGDWTITVSDNATLDTGTFDSWSLAIKGPGGCAEPCPADIDGSGDVGVKDLLFLLGAWGDCPAKGDCPADFDDSGDVGVKDLLFLLGAWGDCP